MLTDLLGKIEYFRAIFAPFKNGCFSWPRSFIQDRHVNGPIKKRPRLCIQDRHVNGPLEIFASGDPLGCLQDRHVNGCPEKRPKLCIQDRHVNGPFEGEHKKWLPC